MVITLAPVLLYSFLRDAFQHGAILHLRSGEGQFYGSASCVEKAFSLAERRNEEVEGGGVRKTCSSYRI